MEDGTATSSGESSNHPSHARMVQAVLRSGALGALGLFAISLWATVLVALAGGTSVGVMVQSALSIVSLGLGTGTIALAVIAKRGLDYVDFEVPSRRDIGYALAGIVAILLLTYLSSALLSLFGVQEASHSVEQTAKSGNPEILLLFIPLSWLIIGPCEELLYRNIIQKSLYDTFSGYGAVVVASGIFALAHVFVYSSGSTPAQLGGTLATIFLLSLVLGTVYLKTENLTASALVHGTFDAIAFATIYLQFTS
ncbi:MULTISPECIES: type II CAAX endopeptidase family protein [unclassified Haladaptatus]|uniref:CPBP family intramembrane glutamic endopeptidase n=1 Tax=unclassified Haladaptatus TaxID=2622732 RepID=UPI00209C61CB|nr:MULTISPECIES: type II CAAX endopeptidase family protein [unclassified Haladaptatus]MCO8242928.1 CPBP family intramembrane metalloprotease [Haladaptatus sp. AB643]MCO8252684.1 CPBP family intramembrane metalloprotease [Haladaptatus sp. AB618]